MSYNKTLYINDKIITIVNIPLKLRQLAKLTVECFPPLFSETLSRPKVENYTKKLKAYSLYGPSMNY